MNKENNYFADKKSEVLKQIGILSVMTSKTKPDTADNFYICILRIR